MKDAYTKAMATMDPITICDILFEIIENVRMGDCLISFNDFWSDCPDGTDESNATEDTDLEEDGGNEDDNESEDSDDPY